jgi:hypothetical protein
MYPLRARMIEQMQLHRKAPGTQKQYLQAIYQLTAYYRRSPDQLSSQEIRQADWADIRKRRVNGPPCSSGKTGAARGVDCTLNMKRTWWNATTSFPRHKGAMAKPPTYNSFMDMVTTPRPHKIKRLQVLITRAT